MEVTMNLTYHITEGAERSAPTVVVHQADLRNHEQKMHEACNYNFHLMPATMRVTKEDALETYDS